MLNLQANAALALQRFAETIRQRFAQRIRDVRLFGSTARGNAHAESDIDVCVVVDALTWDEKREIWDAATTLNIQHDTQLSPLVLRPEELEHLRSRERRLALDIDQEGVQIP